MCGTANRRMKFGQDEVRSLSELARGCYARKPIGKGEMLTKDHVILAIPTFDGQLTAGNLSKYTEYYAKKDIAASQPVLMIDLDVVDNREKIYAIVQRVKKVARDANISIPGMLDLEISHHYGVDQFSKYGCTMISVINREYCKKLIILVPGQKHPEQYHQKKEESFQVLHGDVLISIDGVERLTKAGDIVIVERGKKHTFSSVHGAILEEVSSTHYKDDSFYTDPAISANQHRKTLISYWMD